MRGGCGDGAVGRVDEFGLHGHPHMRVRAGLRGDEAEQRGDQECQTCDHDGNTISRNRAESRRQDYTPAAPPSARGSCAASIVPFGDRMAAPAWPMVSE